MEYMRLGGFLGKAVSNLINKGIETKIGIRPHLEILDLNLRTNEDEDEVRVTIEAAMTRQAFEKLIEEATK